MILGTNADGLVLLEPGVQKVIAGYVTEKEITIINIRYRNSRKTLRKAFIALIVESVRQWTLQAAHRGP